MVYLFDYLAYSLIRPTSGTKVSQGVQIIEVLLYRLQACDKVA